MLSCLPIAFHIFFVRFRFFRTYDKSQYILLVKGKIKDILETDEIGDKSVKHAMDLGRSKNANAKVDYYTTVAIFNPFFPFFCLYAQIKMSYYPTTVPHNYHHILIIIIINGSSGLVFPRPSLH